MKDNNYHPEFVKRLFNKMSSSYERMNYITSFGFSIRWRTQFLKPIHSTKKKIEVIDLLTGMGETWGPIKSRWPNSKLTALDFSKGMLHSANKKNNRKFNKTIAILQQDILNNDLPSERYDIVTCAFGLKTFNNDQLILLAQEVKRILKHGGQFTFIEVSKPKNIILKTFYGFYLGRIIPILGKLLNGKSEQYQMLWFYTQNFESSKNAEAVFTRTGLITKHNSYFFGCATGFYGMKA